MTNTGNVALTGVQISDPLTPVNGGPIDLDIGASDTTTFTAEYTLTQDDIGAGQVTNQATVAGQDPGGNPVGDLSDDNNNVDDDPTVTIVAPAPPGRPAIPVPVASWWMLLILLAGVVAIGRNRLAGVRI